MVGNYVCPVLLGLILGIVGANRMPPAPGCRSRVSVEVGGVYLDWGTLGAASSDMLVPASDTSVELGKTDYSPVDHASSPRRHGHAVKQC